MKNKIFNIAGHYCNHNELKYISIWTSLEMNILWKKKWLLSFLLAIGVHVVFSQTINVDAAYTIKTFDHNPAAINLNYLMDDDSYLNSATPLTQSLANMGIGMLRYPGGEKADNYLWSAPPYTSASPYFATQGNCNWPNNDAKFSSNQINPLSTTMDFDEFMVVCKSLSAAPLIVVAGDAHYNTWCSQPPTLNDLITNAVEWVKYANVTNNYNIKYWVVGNESWNKAAYGNPGTASQYANDFIQFSKAMKAVDPTISVVANSQQGPWIDTLLQLSAEYVDAVAISNYPVYNWTNGYDRYRTGDPNFVAAINSVVSSIGNNKIRVIVAEYNSIDWSGNWSSENDLGHALVNFQMFGDQISIPEVDDAYLWNTRWVDNLSSPNHLNDAIDSNGDLNATGKAMAMWGNNFLDKLVFSDDSGFVNSFATVDYSGDNLNIFLVNKDYTSKNVTINVANYPAIYSLNLTISESKLTGTSIVDKYPTITSSSGNTTVSGSQVNIMLDPLSINVVKLKANVVLSVELMQDNNILVYPIPSDNVISVRASQSELNQISIYNMLGQDVTMLTTIIENDRSTIKIDLDDLNTGFYIVRTNRSVNKIFKK
jgi:alpha-L-arabinofuranosidase